VPRPASRQAAHGGHRGTQEAQEGGVCEGVWVGVGGLRAWTGEGGLQRYLYACVAELDRPTSGL
jgi:hypothetical protein